MESIIDALGPNFKTVDQVETKPRNELGQEDFIRLMVAQLKNQDPTNPLENNEFLGQMAQFSMVSGIDELGTSFDGMVSNLFTSQAMMAAQLIEREVLVDAGPIAAANFEGEEIQGSFETESPTTNARVNVYDTAGILVETIFVGAVDAGSHPFVWSGSKRDGGVAEPGNYLFTAEGLVDGVQSALPMQQYSAVSSVSVDRNNSTVLLHLVSGDTVNFSSIKEFR